MSSAAVVIGALRVKGKFQQQMISNAYISSRARVMRRELEEIISQLYMPYSNTLTNTT